MHGWILLALLATAPGIVLEQPVDRSALRGEPARLSVIINTEQPVLDLQIEVDGQTRAAFSLWSRRHMIELEPGLHRVAVTGRDPSTGAPLRSRAAQVAVFPEADATRLDPRRRNGLTAALAFVIAIGGAWLLRRRRGQP